MTTKYQAAYIRRSSSTADNPGEVSKDAQLAAVRSLAGEGVTVFEDWGISGLKINRPDYLRLKAEIAAGKVSSVSAYSLSRLGRRTRELLDFVDLCQAHDVRIRTSVESLDTTSAMGRAMLTIMGAFGQLEAELAAERQASARAARVARGDDMSAPYGYRLARQAGGRLARVRDESVDLDGILAVYKEAGSIQGACKLLNERGIPAPMGGNTWATSALTRIVDRETPGVRGRRSRGGVRLPTRSVLTGLVTCPACGQTMTPVGTRDALYCSAAWKTPGHGKSFTKDGAILAMLHGLTDGRTFTRVSLFRRSTDAAITKAEERWRRANVRYSNEGISDEDFVAETARWKDAQESASEEAGWDFTKMEGQPFVRWGGETVDTNADLRRVFSEVRLDATFAPIEAIWRDHRLGR